MARSTVVNFVVAVLLCTFTVFAIANSAIDRVAAQPNIGGCDIFPADWTYNTVIEDAEVDPSSDCYINQLIEDASTPYIRLDMGNNLDDGYGIPYSSGPTGPSIDLDLTDGYAGESDCVDGEGNILRPCCEDGCIGKWLAPYDTEIESQNPENTNPSDGDRHTAYVDTDRCLLYETYATHRTTDPNGWTVASSAIWDLSNSDFPQRGEGWTSADAAGLPILPGLMRFDEFDAGDVKHAFRFTAENAQRAYVYPANHFGVTQNKYNLPYGMVLRLKADFDASEYTDQGKVLIAALKKYGMFFADQGTGFYISGTSNVGWANEFFDEINQNGPGRRIHINNFEVIKPDNEITYGYDVGSFTCDDGGDGDGDGGDSAASTLGSALTDLVN